MRGQDKEVLADLVESRFYDILFEDLFKDYRFQLIDAMYSLKFEGLANQMEKDLLPEERKEYLNLP